MSDYKVIYEGRELAGVERMCYELDFDKVQKGDLVLDIMNGNTSFFKIDYKVYDLYNNLKMIFISKKDLHYPKLKT